MSKKEFAEFINRQAPIAPAGPPPPEPDWAAELQQWLKHLADLYALVDSALADFTAKGQIVVESREIELTEENIGRYRAPSRIIKFGTNTISMVPIGTLLIGTKGRVDMTGPRGVIRLILADKSSTGVSVTIQVRTEGMPPPEPPAPKKIDWEWKMVLRNTGMPKYQKLTPEVFLDALIEIANG